jgi:predicted small secreted protein
MKIPLLRLAAVLAFALVVSGCATRNTMSGGKETTVLGGAVTVATESFQPVAPTTLNVNTSEIAGKSGPSGKKVSLLWGLVTLHDY